MVGCQGNKLQEQQEQQQQQCMAGEEREVVGQRRGEHAALMIPASFFREDRPLPSLRGTITVLADAGLSDEEVIAWLHAPEDSLEGGSAIASLHAGAKTEVRRRAQEHAF